MAEEYYYNECRQATVNNDGGSLQVYGYISTNGEICLRLMILFVTRHTGRCVYIMHLIGYKFILQQDNDRKTYSHVIKYFFFSVEKNKVEVMVWLPQSPDLNIIASVWDYVKDVGNNMNAGFFQEMCASCRWVDI